MENILVRPIEAAQTHALRRSLLRPNRPLFDSIYLGDDAPQSLHLGAWSGGEIVGIASITREKWPRDATLDAFRLRGMAVDPRFQRRGIGALLVREGLTYVQTQGGKMLWCNARTPARDFYLSLGFESVGQEFEIPEIGPHYLMRRCFECSDYPASGTGFSR